MTLPKPTTSKHDAAYDSLHIQGGLVIDPAHHEQPVQRDVFVEHGVIVERLSDTARPRVIDARHLLVMAGGVDMHTHIASTGVNTARQLQADMTFAGTKLVPSTTDTGRLYSALGYTTAIEAAVAPSDALNAHMQLQDTPNLDTGILVLVDNHQLVIELIEKNDPAGVRAVVAQLLRQTGALGMKVVNPAGVAAWRRDASRDQVEDINQPIPGSTVTPKQILQTLTQISEDLNLPHPTHIHGSRLGMPGNFQTLIDSLNAIQGRRAHVAHLQFYAYGRSSKGNFTSAAPQLCHFLEQHPHITADVGMVMFGPAFTITADTPLEHGLWRRTGSRARPAVFCESELEAAYGVMPTSYDKTNRIHSLQWAIGMELLLLHPNPWQLCLSIDHPNGGSFLHFPAIVAMLMNKPLRDEMLAQAHPYATRHTSLASIQREMSLQEIAILTRTGPARMLGLSCKGHLKPGADADLTLYHADYSVQERFAKPAWVIQNGQCVAQEGNTLINQTGRQMRAGFDATHTQMLTDSRLLCDWQSTHSSVHCGQFGLNESQLSNLRTIHRS